MNTLCYMPRTCALGIHIILEEIGQPYELRLIDLRKQAQHEESYRMTNPKGKVPALVREDGSVLTEFPAIAMWLALTYPEKHLLPVDPEGIARVLEVMDYSIATLHMQGWTRYWRTQHYSSVESEQAHIKEHGKEIVLNGFNLLDGHLERHEWIVNDEYSIADCAMFVIEYWVTDVAKWELPPNVAAHYERMKRRPAVQRMAKAEGIAELLY